MSNDQKLSLTDKMKAAAAAGAAKGLEDAKKEPTALANAMHKAEDKKHSMLYKGNNVKRLVLRNGTIVLPDADGVFEPKSQEEYDMLEHLAARSDSSLEKLSD